MDTIKSFHSRGAGFPLKVEKKLPENKGLPAFKGARDSINSGSNPKWDDHNRYHGICSVKRKSEKKKSN
jgi:hypothetical protein